MITLTLRPASALSRADPPSSRAGRTGKRYVRPSARTAAASGPGRSAQMPSRVREASPSTRTRPMRFRRSARAAMTRPARERFERSKVAAEG